MDFSRAFETIVKMWIENNELKWYQTYLRNRTHTTIKNVQSCIKTTDLGVPQGSVSGAKLFSLYINSVENVIEHSQINLFADDTMIYIISDNIKLTEEQMNEDLLNLKKWLSKMKLKLNTGKTKHMIINERKDENVKLMMNNEQIEKIKRTKYLGVIIGI